MKIRHGFVTNSSSSSFIISTNDEIPSSIKNYFRLITGENILPFFLEEIYDYNDYQELEETNKFTFEQMGLIKLHHEGKLTNFLRIKKAMENTEECIYNVSGDRDYIYDNHHLQEFLKRSTVTGLVDLSD